MNADNENWYDKYGDLDENGPYDAGGHYHAERDAR
jgi:hypothetical protein